MKSKNLTWIIIFISIIIICLAWFTIASKTSVQKIARISVDGETVKIIEDLYPKETQYTTIKSKNGYNKIGWYNGEIWVEKSDCKNQTCVEFGKLSVKGIQIICAPHEVTIEIEDDGSQADLVH